MNENTQYWGSIVIKIFILWMVLPIFLIIILFVIGAAMGDGDSSKQRDKYQQYVDDSF